MRKSLLIVVALLFGAGAFLTYQRWLSKPNPASLRVTSEAFADGATIPIEYTCDEEDRSPPLSWADLPEGTRSVAVVVGDPIRGRNPFKGPFVIPHWVLYDLPPDTTSLPGGLPRTPILSNESKQGLNWRDMIGYTGPCPPPGGPAHRYGFTVYALDARTDLEPGATRDELLLAMRGHIIAQGELQGTYKRKDQ